MQDNIVIRTFQQGGPIMWPLLLTAVIAVAVFIERVWWWVRETRRTDARRLEQVLMQIEEGDVAQASKLAENSEDPVLRMIWHGLNHVHCSLQGAMQMAAGIELERAGRFLAVLDTIITLAPLLGLLGTVTGIMHSFSFVGNEEVAAVKVSGGIAEALIATACGLAIAMFCLIPFNYFQRRIEKLRFKLETQATNVEVMLEKLKAKTGYEA
jgi:biopolymer transport protein ExbB